MKAYLQITLSIKNTDREAAVTIYSKYKEPFLNTIKGAQSKELLIREEDVEVLHGFDTTENAQNYLESDLFNNDVVTELQPLLGANPEIKIYNVF
jgi:hypothetical protein